MPIPLINQPLHFAIACFSCSGVIAIGGFKSGGGKTKEKAPWNVMNWHIENSRILQKNEEKSPILKTCYLLGYPDCLLAMVIQINGVSP